MKKNLAIIILAILLIFSVCFSISFGKENQNYKVSLMPIISGELKTFRTVSQYEKYIQKNANKLLINFRDISTPIHPYFDKLKVPDDGLTVSNFGSAENSVFYISRIEDNKIVFSAVYSELKNAEPKSHLFYVNLEDVCGSYSPLREAKITFLLMD